MESDPGRLQEIFLNLITNAFAALKDCGRLAITASMDDDKTVRIDVSDNGHGIRKEDLDRVFEPFFSTKIGSGGTGLGLSITYGLIQELGGSIKVTSEEGIGTTFTIRLPVVAPNAASDKHRKTSAIKEESS
jgi:signal transduction histidine kinase